MELYPHPDPALLPASTTTRLEWHPLLSNSPLQKTAVSLANAIDDDGWFFGDLPARPSPQALAQINQGPLSILAPRYHPTQWHPGPTAVGDALWCGDWPYDLMPF